MCKMWPYKYISRGTFKGALIHFFWKTPQCMLELWVAEISLRWYHWPETSVSTSSVQKRKAHLEIIEPKWKESKKLSVFQMGLFDIEGRENESQKSVCPNPIKEQLGAIYSPIITEASAEGVAPTPPSACLLVCKPREFVRGRSRRVKCVLFFWGGGGGT